MKFKHLKTIILKFCSIYVVDVNDKPLYVGSVLSCAHDFDEYEVLFIENTTNYIFIKLREDNREVE